jgi:alkaline phosphatase
MKKLFAALVALAAATVPLAALNVYPIDRAQILAGAKFDFKVELYGVQDQAGVSLTINGKAPETVLGKKPSYVTEDLGKAGQGSAYLLRDVVLKTPGTYKVDVADAFGSVRSVTWTVFAPAKKAVAKNVIFLLADGMSVGTRTAARLLSLGSTEGTSNGLLALDQMDRVGMVGTSSVDAITVDSANSMSAYMTGQKTSINAMGVAADRTPDPFDDPKQETIAEIIKRSTKKSVGIVSDAELEDATPAAVIGHTRIRDEKAALVQQFLDFQPEVLLGGGSAYFLPKSVNGSKRKDDTNYIDLFQKAGYELATTNTELLAAAAKNPKRLLGLFHPSNMDGSLDRKILKTANTVPQFPDQPDLTTMAQVALDKLSKNKDGFFLMVEAGLIDKFEHPMDWERAVYDAIMYDKVVALAQAFAKTHPDTLIIAVGDHTHSISVYGTVDDSKPGTSMRDKVGSYQNAGFPNYVDSDGDGYPDTPAVSKRLAVGFGNHPDYWETFKPKLDGTFAPTVKNEKGQYVANDKYKSDDAVLIQGNLAYSDATEVHSVDDQVVNVSGPGEDQVKGYQENTALFRYMAEALGLKP